MADLTKSIKIVVDATTAGAKSSLSSLKGDVAQAEGAFGKLKAGASGSFDLIKSAGPLAVAGVGAAIGGFVAKGIGDFTKLAISAENFSTAAGTSIEDASRWIEVSSDLGVETDAVQGAMARLNREADQGKLAKFGITAQDANGRLLQTLQYLSTIPDEAQRSQAAFELFGKASASLTPLIANAGELKDRLAEVSGAKIIDEGDIADAKEFRDSMDRISDAVDNLVLSAGKIALPFAEVIAEIGGPIAELIGKLTELRAEAQKKADSSDSSWQDKLIGFFTQTGPEAADFWLNKIDEITGGTGDRFGKAGDAALKLGDIVEGQGEKFVVLANETKNVTGYTDEQIAALVDQAKAQAASGDAAIDGADAQKDAAAATKKLADEAKDAAAAERDRVAALDESTKALLDHNDVMKGLTDTRFAYNKAARDSQQALSDLDGAVKAIADSDDDAATKERNLQQLYEDTTEKVIASAEAQQKLAEDTATSSGTTLTATQKLDTYNASLIASASATSGPVRESILQHIKDVNGIPAEKVTAIEAAIAAGDLAEAQRLLDEASAARKAAIIAEANTTQAKLDLDRLSQTRDVTLRVHTDAPQARASGGPVTAGETYIVGEQRPELFVPSTNGRIVPSVPPSSGSASNGRAVAASPTINVTVNGGGPGVAREIINELSWALLIGRVA